MLYLDALKPIEIATLGIRLMGMALIAFGIVLALSGVILNGHFDVPQPEVLTSELRLHDTYYVVTNVRYELFVPGGAGMVVGTLLLLLSRRIARLLARDLNVS